MDVTNTSAGKSSEFPIVIVGAGFSGLGMAIRLRKAGIDSFTILEASDEVGGTWRDNTYPGCACDVPSHLYSYSFAPTPNWSRMYSEQNEILQYLRHLVSRFSLESHIRYQTKVIGLTFEEKAGLWHIDTESGECVKARVVVGATGPLNKPKFPSIPGRETFEGVSFHSSQWNHSYDLAGKRVAVIGTGASSIQLVPKIAPTVQHLTLFQRTPPWVVPKFDFAFAPWAQKLFRWIPPVRWLMRMAVYWQLELRALGFVSAPKLLEKASIVGKQHIKKQIEDPTLRELVTPNYAFGCKRVLISNDYYPALQRDNVSLVTTDITEILPHGVRCSDGSEVEVDCIVYSTGFNVYDFLGPMNVTGLNGKDLRQTWSEGARTLYGIAASGFPNLFFMIGPNTGLGHNSLVFMMESQIHYILQCVQKLKNQNLRYLDAKSSAQEKFHQRVQKRMKRSIWRTGGCESWYLNESGENYSLWPGYTFEYWLKTRRMKSHDFHAV